MSIYRRFHGHGLPYFVPTNTNERCPIFRDHAAAQMLQRVIAEVQTGMGVIIHAYVIMPDHLHIVLTLPPKQRISRVMRLIKGRFSKRWNARTGGSRAVWQSRYHEEALRSDEALRGAVDYVHWNPVVAGFVQCPEDWPWSSAYPEQGEMDGQSS